MAKSKEIFENFEKALEANRKAGKKGKKRAKERKRSEEMLNRSKGATIKRFKYLLYTLFRLHFVNTQSQLFIALCHLYVA